MCSSVASNESYHEDIVGFPPCSVPCSNRRVAGPQRDVCCGLDGGIRQGSVVDHNLLVFVLSLNFGQTSCARNLSRTGSVCSYKKAVFLYTDGHPNGARQRRERCRQQQQPESALPGPVFRKPAHASTTLTCRVRDGYRCRRQTQQARQQARCRAQLNRSCHNGVRQYASAASLLVPCGYDLQQRYFACAKGDTGRL